MIVRNLSDLNQLGQIIHCPKGDFISNRFILAKDGLGYSITKTVIPKGTDAIWHYKNHLESCYCVSGDAMLKDLSNGVEYRIQPDTLYALNLNEKHRFHAFEDTVLICVFNPPLKGNEVHKKDFSYE